MPPIDDQTDPTRLPVRRRPQLSRFLVAGALLGVALGMLISLTRPDAAGSTAGQQAILLAATGAVLGAFLASMVYLVLDRRSERSSGR
ncbi:hypothetical protein [Serinicoccus kebangsaanensis]|uniref:hypothetical protein n=1 Tax=Serinicoccus kebangsaanensis TaxID=2602069 RepID=UPI00124C2DDA|nr:hypothetical protein [Serinicoccus kebangsaanensis]